MKDSSCYKQAVIKDLLIGRTSKLVNLAYKPRINIIIKIKCLSLQRFLQADQTVATTSAVDASVINAEQQESLINTMVEEY